MAKAKGSSTATAIRNKAKKSGVSASKIRHTFLLRRTRTDIPCNLARSRQNRYQSTNTSVKLKFSLWKHLRNQ